MGIFSEDKTAVIEGLQAQIAKLTTEKRDLAEKLRASQAKNGALQLEIAAAGVEVEKFKSLLGKAKQRQKASVERANRFKAKLSTEVSSGVIA